MVWRAGRKIVGEKKRSDVGKAVKTSGHEGLVARERSLDLTQENGEPMKDLNSGREGQAGDMMWLALKESTLAAV